MGGGVAMIFLHQNRNPKTTGNPEPTDASSVGICGIKDCCVHYFRKVYVYELKLSFRPKTSIRCCPRRGCSEDRTNRGCILHIPLGMVTDVTEWIDTLIEVRFLDNCLTLGRVSKRKLVFIT